ncbi:MAG: VWA domain-containing protein, partial [Acidobacteria bacterium]|nr:VWA domain-containing protein [Acidobacteriota bacterium]
MAITLVCGGAFACLRNAAAQEPANQTIRIGSNEVLLDVVVRDKRGRPMRDLRPEEIEIYEDNARQTLASFRLIETALTNSTAHKPNEAATHAPKPFDPALPVNLVTIVFDNLDANGRRLARASAHDFFQQLPPNTFVAIFAVNLGFHVLQPFTSDREKLKQAVELMARRADNRFPSMSKQIVEQLEIIANSTDFGPPAGAPAQSTTANSNNAPAATTLAGLAPSGAPAGGGIDKALAQMTVNAMRAIEAMQLDMQARASVQALINLVRQQKQLIGRKSLLYFSNGMVVPPHLVPLLRTAISEANQNNVSIYTLDARGLDLSEDTTRAKEKLAQAIAG